ncbi:putative nuclease HARBI1 isoform X2 [Monomorium pharaonis]|uniref:putative nuclease HARBI1 isoform X2 n=1 Tax=Monomorium pharaonis TaxID=307658 RepID=UPI001745D606|nr:putative nuclease HARBI1 isoform X2 [Monomorium pharaonis]
MENIDNLILDELLNDDNDDNDDDDDDDDEVEELLIPVVNDQELINIIDIGVEDAPILRDLIHGDRRNRGILNLHYYEHIVPHYNDNQFHSHFRMSRELYEELENLIYRQIRQGENNVPLRKKILLTIWIVGTPESFRSVADRFGLSKSNAHIVFKEVICALKEMMPQFVKWPNAEECENNERIFRMQSRGFPGVVGAIDGCHIPIKQPPGNANDYYNRKGFHSINFQDCLIGRPGRAHDAAVFRSSSIFNRLMDQENPILPPQKHIIGDSAYPLLQNLMTPFRDNGHLTPEQSTYNTKLSSIRSIVERAFGLLKCKWRRLKYLDVKSVRMANYIIAAACTLHNFLLMHDEIDIRENYFMNEDINNENDEDYNDINVDENEAIDENARMKREQIMNNL